MGRAAGVGADGKAAGVLPNNLLNRGSFMELIWWATILTQNGAHYASKCGFEQVKSMSGNPSSAPPH
jgi:hypothetical protein